MKDIIRLRKSAGVTLAFALVASAATAATYTFPKAGKDIGTDWGDGNMPGTSDVAKFVTPASATAPLTSSVDVVFGKILISPESQGKTFVFDLRNSGRTVELTQDIVDGNSPQTTFAFNMRSTTVYCKGGTWNSSGSGLFTAGGKASCLVQFSDAATLTVAGTLVAGYATHGDKLILTGGTTATAEKVLIGRSAGQRVINTTLEVRDGSSLTVGNHLFSEEQTSVSNGTLLVTGTGTKFSMSNTYNVQIGYRTDGNRLLVNDHASFTCGQLFVGGRKEQYTPSHNNFVYMDEATLTLQTCRIGDSGSGNLAEFTNTEITVSGVFDVGHSSISSNNVAKFFGPRTTLSYKSGQAMPLFGAGSWNTVVFADGAQHDLPGASEITLTTNAHDNVVRVENGGQIAKTGGMLTFAGLGGYNNALEVFANGTNQFYNLHVCAHDNRIVVSNGVLRSERNDVTGFSMTMGFDAGGTAEVRDNRLVLRGASPLVSLPYSGIKLLNASVLRYELTADGYATAPVSCQRLLLSDDSVLEVEPTALLAADDVPTRRICLATCARANGLTVPATVLAAANERMPSSRCRLYVNGDRLMLRVAGTRGMAIIVK